MTLSELMHFLEKKHRVSINMHCLHPAFGESASLKLQPEQYLHHGGTCRRAKLEGHIGTCAAHKSKNLLLAAKGNEFVSVCPFGLAELCRPVKYSGGVAAVLYFGNMIPSSGTPPHLRAGEAGSLPKASPEKLEELRVAAAFLERFIVLEIEIWTASGGLKGRKRDEKFYIENVMMFIENNFTRNVGLSDAAEILKVTPNHLGEIIGRHSGKSFRRLLNERRIREAEIYLGLHRDLSIGRIASACGFFDSNYFSTVFRRETGMPPTEYRRKFKDRADS